ncbi:MAG: RHS repeat-associated core domain-containing protein [Pyrinomonadaceae bacterium]
MNGDLIRETYPSGRVVKNTLNSDGELSRVQSRKNSTFGFWTYAGAFRYNETGALTKMHLGNGRWETASYNDRLQETQIGLGMTSSAQDLLKLEFEYNSSGQTNNSGLLREQKITVPAAGSNPAFTAVQAYEYDNLNRIQSTEEKVSGVTIWNQTFTIDRYGNRRYDPANTSTLGSCSQSICNPTISTANNRFATGQGFLYDQNGNITQDATNQRFRYDAENHQKAFFSANNSGSTPDWTYHYDGDGRRVRKQSANGDVTVFVYNAGAKLIAEYSTTVVPVEQAKVAYMTGDHLGSPRIITDQNGAVISRRDYTPYGDEVISPHRVAGTSGNGYNPPNVRLDFTGYEKDDESGLQFAQARNLSTVHGRFQSVDPLNESGNLANPQTLNRYAYVANDPLNAIDPSGMAMCSAEYSYSDCGGDEGFWGGEFGDHVAYDKQSLGTSDPRTQAFVSLHLERISNSQAGKGFITNSEAETQAAALMFDIFYLLFDDGSLWTNFSIGVKTPAPLAWHQKGIVGDIGDWSWNAGNNLTNGLVEYVDRNFHGMDDAEVARLKNSSAGRGGDNVATILGVALPGPGKVKAIARIDETVRGTKRFAKDLFRIQAGDRPLKVMRDVRTGRIKGVRTGDASVFYRPKGGRNGVTANVEVINANGIRVNIHVRP